MIKQSQIIRFCDDIGICCDAKNFQTVVILIKLLLLSIVIIIFSNNIEVYRMYELCNCDIKLYTDFNVEINYSLMI